jgi:hypothetical protein
MSTVKISDLVAIATINSNTSNTLFVGVDIPTGVTGKLTAHTLAQGLYSNEILNVGQSIVSLPNTVAQFSLSGQSYVQTNLVNTNDGGSADHVITANTGTDSTYFIDMGYANKDYEPGQEFNNIGTAVNRLDGYIYAQGSTSNTWGGNLIVGSTTTGKEIRFIAGGGSSNAVVAKMSSSALTLNRNVVFADGSSQNTSSGSASAYANSAYAKANSAGQYANASFGAANSAGAFANSAADSVSSALINAGVADTKAVVSGRYANSAFSTANAASIYANGAFLAANTPSLTANSAAEFANSAFLRANTPSSVANSAALYANGAFSTANSALANTNNATFGGNLYVAGNILPTENNFFALGSSTLRWGDIHLGPNTIFLTDTSTGATGNLTLTGGILQINGVTALGAGNTTIYANGTIVSPNVVVTGTFSANTGITYNANTYSNVVNANTFVYGSATANSMVTQLTSKSTSVTANGISGQITMHNASLAGQGFVSFTVNNSYVQHVNDIPIVAIQNSVTSPNPYQVCVGKVAVGSFNISVYNCDSGGGSAHSDAIVLNWSLLRVGS